MFMSKTLAAGFVASSFWGAGAMQRSLEHAASNISTEVAQLPYPIQRVLIVDVRGPTRGTGDGVRVMGMLMDLQSCGHTVEVFSDAEHDDDLKKDWDYSVSKTFLGNVHFWKQANRQNLHLDHFDRIILGGKLDLLYTEGQAGHAVPSVLDELYSRREQMRHKVVAFWDDVPFERCRIKPEADEICQRVVPLVEKMAASSHKFYVLSVDDRNRMVSDMQGADISLDNLEVFVWPMSIANMQKAIPSLRFTGATPSRTLVTMMGNLHAVNKMMVTTLFQSGAVAKMCSAISIRNSPVRIVFMGGLAEVAVDMKNAHLGTSGCVDVRTGFITDEELEKDIFPKTRAILNPFFEDVNSGISVKNFESIMTGVPFLSSEYGMHGLSDEIPDCAAFPMPPSAGDRMAFAQFFIDNVVDTNGYPTFAAQFAEYSPKCISGQTQRHPPELIC